MRLLNVLTKRLEDFSDERAAPPYGILSHTWDKEEITFVDMATPHDKQTTSKAGYAKIEFVCRRAKSEDISYAWIDTCCIDKSSSAELSEAINSMWRWYKQSKICWVHLADLPPDFPRPSKVNIRDSQVDGSWEWRAVVQMFKSCRWFTRGWTLQELLAPQTVQFWNVADYVSVESGFLGSLQDVVSAVHFATGIDLAVLEGESGPKEYSVAQRMSWAAGRSTTRVEDVAYSLMGLFDINMPLLYGEGEKAFQRLQEEIMRQTIDHTLFAWHSLEESTVTPRLLALSPTDFAKSSNIVKYTNDRRGSSYRMTNAGLEISLPTIYPWLGRRDRLLVLLDCGIEDGFDTTVGLILSPQSSTGSNAAFNGASVKWSIAPGSRLRVLRALDNEEEASMQSLTIDTVREQRLFEPDEQTRFLFKGEGPSASRYAHSMYPPTLIGIPHRWNKDTMSVIVKKGPRSYVSLAFTHPLCCLLITVGARLKDSTDVALVLWNHMPGSDVLRERALTDQRNFRSNPVFGRILDVGSRRVAACRLHPRARQWATVTLEMRLIRSVRTAVITITIDGSTRRQPLDPENLGQPRPGLIYEVADLVAAQTCEPSSEEKKRAHQLLSEEYHHRGAFDLACDMREKMLAEEDTETLAELLATETFVETVESQ